MCLLLRSGVCLATVYCKELIGGVLQRSPHLHRGTLELCQSDHRVLGHLPGQGPSPPIAQFGRVASSRKSLGGSKLLPFKNDGGRCVLGDLQCLQTFFAALPQICASTHSCLGALRTICLTSWLGFCSDMHCQLRDLIQTGVCLSKSCPINCIYNRWTPIKL